MDDFKVEINGLDYALTNGVHYWWLIVDDDGGDVFRTAILPEDAPQVRKLAEKLIEVCNAIER